MRRSVDVGEWLAALDRSDDGLAALAADYAVETTHLDAPHGGPFEVFLSARPHEEAQPEPEPVALGGSNIQALLELSSSDSESDDEPVGIQTVQAAVNLPTAWPKLDGPRTPRYERKWWRDPLPRRSLFAADPPPPPPPPPEPEPEPPMPLTWCTCAGHGAVCSHDRRFLLPDRLQAEPASIEERFGLCVHTVRFPRCNMRAAVTLAPGEVLQIRLGSQSQLGKPASPDLWRLHGRVDLAVLRRSGATDSAELQVFTALSPANKVGTQWSVSTRIVLRCLRSIGGPTGYAWVDVTITPLAKQMRESQPSVRQSSADERCVEDPQTAARRHQARLLGVFRALDHNNSGHVSLVDLQKGLQRNHRGWEVSIREIRSFLAKSLGRSSVGLEQISFGEFVKLVAGLPMPTTTSGRLQQTTHPSHSTGRKSPVDFGPEEVSQRISDHAGDFEVDAHLDSEVKPNVNDEDEGEPEPGAQPKVLVPESPVVQQTGTYRPTETAAPMSESQSADTRRTASTYEPVRVELPRNDAEFSAMLHKGAAGSSAHTYRHLVLWTARWLPCAKPMRRFFRELATQERTEHQYPNELGRFALADISECPVAAETVMAVPCFACYDNTTRVAEFEFAGENFEALELSVLKALVMPPELQRELALELLPEFIESLLQHVMDVRLEHDETAEVGESARRETGAVAGDGGTISDEIEETSSAVGDAAP